MMCNPSLASYAAIDPMWLAGEDLNNMFHLSSLFSSTEGLYLTLGNRSVNQVTGTRMRHLLNIRSERNIKDKMFQYLIL